MAEVQEIIIGAGPLPIETKATIETDGPTVLTIAGSVWTPQANSMIGVRLLIDGSPAVTAQIFSNESNEHRTVVPITVPWTFTIGPHTFTLQELTSETTSDANDYFCVTVQY